MAGTKVKVKVTQGKSTVSPPRDYFFLFADKLLEVTTLPVASLRAEIVKSYQQMEPHQLVTNN